MAPRGRPPKNESGSRRIDGAYEHMRPYGFSKALVRETVKELLEVYGGKEGWFFIEAESYQLLIDAIIDKQENGKPKESEDENGGENVLDMATVGENSSGCPIAVDAGPSNLCLPLSSSGIKGPDAQPNDIEVTQAAGEGQGCTDIVLEENNDKDEVVNENHDNDTGSSTQLYGYSPPPPPPSPSVNTLLLPPNGLPHRRRKPCYGWISDDVVREEDIINSLLLHRRADRRPHDTNSREDRKRRETRWDK